MMYCGDDKKGRRIPTASIWLLYLLLFSLLGSKTRAFSIDGGSNGGKTFSMEKRVNANNKKISKLQPWFITPAFILLASSWYPMEAASAAPFQSPEMDAVVINKLLSDTNAFKSLPRERAYSGAVKELIDQQDLQDSRLQACQDKGIWWEQCFMFGQNDGDQSVRGRMDSQLISPMGLLNPPSDSQKIPTW